jgi:hypothetical protein
MLFTFVYFAVSFLGPAAFGASLVWRRQ